jgi:hypothetical protein
VSSFRKAKTAKGLGVGSAEDGQVDGGAEAEDDDLDEAGKKKSDGSDSDVLDLDLTKCEGAQGQGEEGEEVSGGWGGWVGGWRGGAVDNLCFSA